MILNLSLLCLRVYWSINSTYLFLLLLVECLGEGSLRLQPVLEHILPHLPSYDASKQGHVWLMGKPPTGLLYVIGILYG